MTTTTESPEGRTGGGAPLPPSLEEPQHREVAVRPGEDAALSAQLSPLGGQPTALTWSRGEQELSPSERVRLSKNNNTVVLRLQSVTCDDVGTYLLVAKNAAGEARAAFDLRVLDETCDDNAPVFLRRLSDLAVKVGTRTRFLVEIRSSNEVQVAWHRNDERVPEGERFAFLHEGNFFCVDVAPVMVEDGGRWTCMAENATGRSSCSSYLNVLGA